MKALSFAFAYLAACFASALLAACGSWPGHEPTPESAQGAPGPGGQAGGAMRGPGGGAPPPRTAHRNGRVIEPGAGRLAMGDMGDLQAMCELDRRMRAARTPEARHAMIDKYMGAMSPETRHHLLTMMREQCQ